MVIQESNVNLQDKCRKKKMLQENNPIKASKRETKNMESSRIYQSRFITSRSSKQKTIILNNLPLQNAFH